MLPTAKLRIIPYENENSPIDTVVGSLGSTIGNVGFDNGYTVQINPDSLNFSHTIAYHEDQSIGGSGSDNSFTYITPGTLDFEVIFDRTGAVQAGDAFGNEVALLSGQGVELDINALKKIILEYNGEIQGPNKVKIVWGKALQIQKQLTFRGKLTNFSYSYKKFNAFGIPLRASVNLSFQGTMSDVLREKLEDKKSPDITHLVTVKEGDTLPMLAQKVYGNSKYYIALANANGIVDFRNLKAGQKIVFPPIE